MNRILDVSAELPVTPLEAAMVVDGTPAAGSRTLTTIAGVEIGVWEITPGTSTDVEVDEVFVVLSGVATVSFQDGETIELLAGTVVHLHAGDQTIWVVHETLRKIYTASF